MAGKDTKKLRDFMAGGAFIEGGGRLLRQAVLAATAATALAAPALADDQGRARIVVDAQAELDAHLGPGAAFVIDPGPDTGDEIAMMYDALAKSEAVTVECVAMGGFPSDDARTLFSGTGIAVEAGDTSVEDVNLFMLYRQLAHCYGEATPAEAELFAVMSVLQRSDTKDFLATAAAAGELLELRDEADLRFGQSGSALSRLATAMQGDAFRASLERLDPVGTLDLAKTVLRLHLVHEDGEWRRDIGKAIGSALGMRQHYVPVREGMVATDAGTWLESASSVPEIGRIVELTGYLSTPAEDRGPLPAFQVHREASAFTLSMLAAAGDPAARHMAPAFGIDTNYGPMELVTDIKTPGAESVPGTLLAFDREGISLRFGVNGITYHGVVPGTRDIAFAGNSTRILEDYDTPAPDRLAALGR